MKRVAERSTIALMLVVVLLGGMLLFAVEFVGNAETWVSFSGSPHVKNGLGAVTDRDGTVLLDNTNGKTYAEDADVRKAMLHWLGDRDGFILAPAATYHAGDMLGFDLVNGLYGYSGVTGSAQMTLSAQVQEAALKAMGKKKGALAVYNYKTGELLCAVSTPTYDPDKVPDIDEEDEKYEGIYLNRFIQTTYVPGSVFKLVTTAAALDTLENARELEFECDKVYEMSGGKITCTGDHGKLTLQKALAKSCNCYFAQLTELLGGQTLEKYVEQFRITEPVSFDGLTTARGKFSLEGASAQQTAWAGIGQYLDMVNPCRYLTFVGAIAGGGEAAEPHVIASAGAYTAQPVSTGRLMSSQTAEALTELMRNNVKNQYGDENFPGLTVCAKSGTAEVGGDKKPNATFAGFCTDADYPLAFMVVVEDAGSGAKTCIPIISEVLKSCKAVLDGE